MTNVGYIWEKEHTKCKDFHFSVIPQQFVTPHKNYI